MALCILDGASSGIGYAEARKKLKSGAKWSARSIWSRDDPRPTFHDVPICKFHWCDDRNWPYSEAAECAGSRSSQ